jgi:small subunit ribosomal protein S2
MAKVSIEQLLEAGAHFGHLTRRWNPQMRNFIFAERNGIHVIDLRKTQILVDLAHDAALEVSSRGGRFMFVGTKKQAKDVIAREAARCGSYYAADRWLGGMLTNFATIRKSIRRMETIEKMESDGTYEKIKKKERLTLSREKEKLTRILGGIRDMTRLPSALFIVDIKKEHIAIEEAHKLGIPIFAIVDTNCDPNVVDYPIPANDDSVRTVELISKVMADAVIEGREFAKVHTMEQRNQEKDAFAAGDDSDDEKRRRPRKRMNSQSEVEIGGMESNAEPNTEPNAQPGVESIDEPALDGAPVPAEGETKDKTNADAHHKAPTESTEQDQS